MKFCCSIKYIHLHVMFSVSLVLWKPDCGSAIHVLAWVFLCIVFWTFCFTCNSVFGDKTHQEDQITCRTQFWLHYFNHSMVQTTLYTFVYTLILIFLQTIYPRPSDNVHACYSCIISPYTVKWISQFNDHWIQLFLTE